MMVVDRLVFFFGMMMVVIGMLWKKKNFIRCIVLCIIEVWYWWWICVMIMYMCIVIMALWYIIVDRSLTVLWLVVEFLGSYTYGFIHVFFHLGVIYMIMRQVYIWFWFFRRSSIPQHYINLDQLIDHNNDYLLYLISQLGRIPKKKHNLHINASH